MDFSPSIKLSLSILLCLWPTFSLQGGKKKSTHKKNDTSETQTTTPDTDKSPMLYTNLDYFYSPYYEKETTLLTAITQAKQPDVENALLDLTDYVNTYPEAKELALNLLADTKQAMVKSSMIVLAYTEMKFEQTRKLNQFARQIDTEEDTQSLYRKRLQSFSAAKKNHKLILSTLGISPEEELPSSI